MFITTYCAIADFKLFLGLPCAVYMVILLVALKLLSLDRLCFCLFRVTQRFLIFRMKAYKCLTARELEIYLSLPKDLAREGWCTSEMS